MRNSVVVRPPGIPLRIRLTLWYTAISALFLCLLALFLYIQLRRSLYAQLDATLELVATQTQIVRHPTEAKLTFEGLENRSPTPSWWHDDLTLVLLSPDGILWERLGSDEEAPFIPTPKTGFATVETAGSLWRVYQHPLKVEDTIGWLQIVQDLDPIEQTLQNLVAQILIGVPLAIGLAGVGGFFLATRALRPMDRMTRTAQAITASDLHQRIGYEGPADEVGRLAATFDAMLDRLQRGFEHERRFTGDAAHELRTPLAALKGRIGVTLSQPRQPAAYIETLQELEQQVDRLIRLSNDLLYIARLEQGTHIEPMERIDGIEFLDTLIEQVRPLADAKSITLTQTMPASMMIHGRFDLLVRLFLNLLDNAIRYTPPQGQITISAHNSEAWAEIAIRDTGVGIAALYIPHLFERFYRVEGDRARRESSNGHSGAGLGLAMVHEIVTLHGGTVSVQSEVGKGSTFVVRLPLA